MVKPVIGIFLSIVLYLIIAYLNGFFAVNSINKEPNMPPLYDRLYPLIPQISRSWPDDVLIGLIGYFVIRWWFGNKILLEHFFIIMTFIFTLRVVCFMVTEEPPPTKGCDERKPGEPTKSFFQMMREIFYSRQCSDLMFSGHASFTVLIMIFTFYYSKYSLEKLLIGIIGVIELILIIAGRLHYSSDVIVGTTITVLSFYSWQHIGLPWM
jgi:hypothetical protein